MSVKIGNVNLLEILPESIKRDEKVVALAKSLDVELKKLSAETKLPLHLPRLNELPHKVLDQLAWQWNAPFFEPTTMDLSTKRLIISNVLHQWFKMGTPYAVRKLLNTFAKGADIQEWFEDGYKKPKQPYHFRLKLKQLEDLSDDGETIMRLISVAKNERSWL